MRFTIMQHAVGYRRDDAAAESLIGGQEGILLRLLILHRGRPVTREAIARQLTRSGRGTVDSGSVPAYIGRLRNRIGADSVRSEAGYSYGLEETQVDAFAFEEKIQQFAVCEVIDVDDDDNEYSGIYGELLDLHAMWHANPALPFEDEQD